MFGPDPFAQCTTVGEVIDDRFEIIGICSNSGGMGTIVHVSPTNMRADRQLVLKFCKATDEEQIKRFKREVRLLSQFRDNPRVVTIVSENLEHDPPYFVMPFYQEGDLSSAVAKLRADTAHQEQTFLSAIDALAELHSRGIYHRDIKPQNFLIDGSRILVSDFGLSTESGSDTIFTKSSAWWGTQGYMPPEFIDEKGGFRDASAAADIYMLGKTFYALLTGRDPTYIHPGSIEPPIFYVIERCCALDPSKRFQTLSDLKQRLVTAYDIVLNRQDAHGAAQQFLQRLREEVARSRKFDVNDARSFVERLAECESAEAEILSKELRKQDFEILCFGELSDLHLRLLRVYAAMVEACGYSWSFAEVIAENMAVFFYGPQVSEGDKVEALRIAVSAATSQNRFAAMDTCRAMISSEMTDSLGFRVAHYIEDEKSFVADIPYVECKNAHVRRVLQDKQRK